MTNPILSFSAQQQPKLGVAGTSFPHVEFILLCSQEEKYLEAEHSPVWKFLRWEGGMEYFQLEGTDKDQPV